MAISVYCGLMGSGKSFEVVRAVIVEAIAKGRRVVTNVDGISHERVRDYVATKRKIPEDKLGSVVHVTNEDVFRQDFLPYYDDVKTSHTDTVVQPGDLVCIDEAWRFWGTSNKLPKEHQSFFLEHRHFTHPDTGVACDLVLMIQDMGTLHRFVKNVVAFSFRMHKKVSLGLSNVYSVTMYEGSKQTKQARIREQTRKYDPEIFPLYSSFKDGAKGSSVDVDSRQNILRNPMVWGAVVFCAVAPVLAGWYVYHFFYPSSTDAPVSSSSPDVTHEASRDPGRLSASDSALTSAAQTTQGEPSALASTAWRIVGSVTAGGNNFVVIATPSGRLRLESPSLFVNADALQTGEVDGQHVTTWSGPETKSSASPVGLQ
ncbi:zonular occludens toxin domain-containing protein [Pandoraea apista]|uniref:zonular occludens toxin domain-containing protein n=1 Tax=Pandoraea apista TaxID=93218 RepID=UPI000F67F962|nr:zonular occludens toxin domain-containing protein [Pandoraea apista]RRW91047.1 zonula occludens toxin [Pandoraea apista]RRX00838.1 zonula occludens toxin [Pandoraea apista]